MNFAVYKINFKCANGLSYTNSFQNWVSIFPKKAKHLEAGTLSGLFIYNTLVAGNQLLLSKGEGTLTHQNWPQLTRIR